MLTPQNWKDYELLDSGFGPPSREASAGQGMKLERWKDIVLARPDPQAIWPRTLSDSEWQKADGTYKRNSAGGGSWTFKKKLPERWEIQYGDLKFWVRPTNFKHTGLFPEQALNWEWLRQQIEQQKDVARPLGRPTSKLKILNLFAYTGAATVACAAAGAEVTHVDAAKGMCEWAGENLELSGLRDKPVRFIVDDVVKFVEREKRRGVKYDGVIMDPPSYGRGASQETWKIEKMLWPLVSSCVEILTPNPLFFLINSYTAGLSPTVLENVLSSALIMRGLSSHEGGETSIIESGELGLTQSSNGLVLPAGTFARYICTRENLN